MRNLTGRIERLERGVHPEGVRIRVLVIDAGGKVPDKIDALFASREKSYGTSINVIDLALPTVRR